jgi:uncharacterized protein
MSKPTDEEITMNSFPITTLYALPLAVIFLALWMNVTSTRSKLSQSIGDGGNVDLHERIRKHGNFVEWVPMVMMLLLLAEARGTGQMWLHAAGALLVIGRVLHPFGLKANNPLHPLRIAGNMGAILATVILFVALLRSNWLVIKKRLKDKNNEIHGSYLFRPDS